MGKVIGIDLGTTNSCVAVIEGGAYKVIENREGKTTTPSIVAFADDGEILVGDTAKNQMVVNPHRTFFEVKRLIGRRFDDPEVAKMQKNVPFKIVEADNGDAWVEMDGKKMAPAQVSAHVLAYLKKDAEDYLGEPVTEAVITVPAYFNDAQRQATKDAGKIAGLDVKRIVNEPTAAAFAYSKDGKLDSGLYAVYDLGGGTYDISIVEVDIDGGNTVLEVKAANGDTFLGGADFDHRLVDHLIGEFKQQTGIDLLAKQKDAAVMEALGRIKEAAEKAKIELSSKMQADINLPYLYEAKNLQVKMTRAAFEGLVADLIQKTLPPMEAALKDAGVPRDKIKEVVLVGGMTRMPKVKEVVQAHFPGKPLNQKVNPMEVVGAGAAVQGGVLSKELKGVLLMDVIPLTIGIETKGGVMTPMVKRNTTIPTNKEMVFSTAEDNQDAVTVRVFQGERPMALDNKLLGEFNLEGILPAPKGVPKIKVTFNVSADGTLAVEAIDQGTNRKQRVTVAANGGLSSNDVERMVREAESHAEEDQKRRDAITVRNNAEAAVIQYRTVLESLGDEGPAVEKAAVEQALQGLSDVLEAQGETKEIEAQFEVLTKAGMDLGTKIYGEQAGNDEVPAAPRPPQAPGPSGP